MPLSMTGSPTTRSHFANSLERNLRKFFLQSAKGFERNNKYPRLYRVENSDLKVERHAVIAGYGSFVATAEGDNPTMDSGQEAWTRSFTHQTFKLGAEFTQEAIEDDPNGIIKRLSKVGGALASVAYYTKERDAMDMFNTYLTSGTVYSAGGSNYPLLSTTHPLITGATWSNRPSSSLDLSIEAVEFAIGHWMVNMVNQRGQVTMSMPGVLLHGASDWAIARRILGTKGRRPQTADNDINALDDYDIEPVCHPLLTNDGRWLLLNPEDEEYGGTYYERVRPRTERLPDGTNGNMRHVGRYRESHGFSHVYGVWGSD